ncbi:CAP domain-containing protein [Paenibacillus crassostreae]|uniref:SCP domain-containing protein n=1 Tax=Paenibacillus crassostreae TaxID=1763538 RepID=A0A167DMX7_9BACL|nr:CAP domain-containing protein [Paenibacillus crassostreae]AOZ91265.1 hypothetical protein LPB68_02965 [Paenibacillus crassostreae]OAB74575.1 hypothetical protein PNBC_10995 [Paenibacillus crassostreae]
MKKSIIKVMMTGTLAAVLAVGIALPGTASAASNQINNNTDLKTYLENWIKNNSGSWSWTTVSKKTTITTPKTETPKTETPKTETPKTETPKTETPKTETPKTETPADNKTTTTNTNTNNTNNTTNNTTTNVTSSFTSQVVNLVNQERSKAGLQPLTSNTELANMALDKAKDMNNNNYFAHQSPTYGSPFDMMKKYGISYRYAGENIAKGQKTPAAVMEAWMNSEGHRANILNANFTTIGVGYYNGYWVQEFISK